MKRFLTAPTFAVLATGAVVAACSYDWSAPPEAGLGDAASDAPPSQPRDATAERVEGDGRCRSNQACALGQFCDFADGMCGQGALGVCTTTTDTCPPDPTNPSLPGGGTGPSVCGCSGQIYESACKAAAAGVDVSSSSARCPPDAGGPSSPCGDKVCGADQYCFVRTGEPAACRSFADCASRDCNCPVAKQSGCACTGAPPSVRVECQ